MMAEVIVRHHKRQALAVQLGFAAAVIALIVLGTGVVSSQAGDAIEFSGTVLTVDQATGRFAVRKDGGGTRFTFTANGHTKFAGAGLASLKDLKKDNHVLVVYRVQGSQYLADSITRK